MIFIRYYENLVIDESVDIELDDIKKMFDEGVAVYNLYVIAVSSLGNGIMEILNSSELLKTVNSSKNYGIIAMAKGRKAIENIMIELILNWIKDKNLSTFKGYYNKRCY